MNKDNKNTLYCSFCGKSQHEVTKLIAGPTVFICNECTELCDDIIWSGNDHQESRMTIKIKLQSLDTMMDDIFYENIVKLMETDFPDLNLKYEFKRPIINKDYSVDTNIIYISTSLKKNLSEKNEKTEYTELQNEVEKLANKINVLTKKYTAESQKSQRLENELRELSIDYLKYIRSNKELENPSSEILSVMFLDIVSFSSMSGSEKDSILDFLRNIAPPLIRERAAKNINMWGDGIVATFSDPNDALDVSARFVRHLAVEQLEARVGIAWGVVRTSFNKTTGRVDISGDTVDFAARIESLAHPGEILLSSDFSELEINTNTYSLVPTNRKLGKAVLNYDPGDTLKLWHLSVRKN